MPFSAILGHDRQKHLLTRSLAAGRLASSYLFTGPEGVGKKLLARAFIKAVFCTQKASCNRCRSCLQFEEGNHPDFIFLDGTAATIKIDDIRATRKELHFKPMEADRRVCLIDTADNMTVSAQTALLKSLEEPKHHTLFVLVSANPDALLPTIRSRCQLLRFNRLPQDRLREKLAGDLAVNASVSALMAALADGSFRNSLDDKREFYLHERKEILREVASLPPPETHVREYFSLAQKLAGRKNLTFDILDILKLFFRDILYGLHGRSDTALVNADLADLVRSRERRENKTSVLKKLEAIRDIEDSIHKNVNLQLAFEVLLMRLSEPPREDASIRTV